MYEPTDHKVILHINIYGVGFYIENCLCLFCRSVSLLCASIHSHHLLPASLNFNIYGVGFSLYCAERNQQSARYSTISPTIAVPTIAICQPVHIIFNACSYDGATTPHTDLPKTYVNGFISNTHRREFRFRLCLAQRPSLFACKSQERYPFYRMAWSEY